MITESQRADPSAGNLLFIYRKLAFPTTLHHLLSMAQWYYNDSGEQRGPVTEDEIRSLLTAHKIPETSLVWTEGMTDWKAANFIPQFQASPYAPPMAPPLLETDWSGYTPSGPQIRPWVRYWVRTFDFLLFCLLSGLVLGFIYPKFLEQNDTILGLVFLFFYNFVEPILLATIGTTPFKALMRIRLRNHDGSKLSYAQALRRTFNVWIRGQGIGIPLVTMITSITSYSRLSNNGITSWDKDGNFTVSHRNVAWWRWLLLVAFCVGFISLIIYGNEI